MAKQYNLVISEEAAEDVEAIRDFGEARKKGLGFKFHQLPHYKAVGNYKRRERD